MAVFNDYVNTNLQAGGLPERAQALQVSGVTPKIIMNTFQTVAAWDAGSIMRLFDLPQDAIILELTFWTLGVTGMSNCTVGLYKSEPSGAEVGTSVLATGIDLSSAVTQANGFNNGLNAVTAPNRLKTLRQLAGETVASGQRFYTIGLCSVADLSEADTVNFLCRFAQ